MDDIERIRSPHRWEITESTNAKEVPMGYSYKQHKWISKDWQLEETTPNEPYYRNIKTPYRLIPCFFSVKGSIVIPFSINIVQVKQQRLGIRQ